MIKTRFDVSVGIDETIFNVTVRELTPSEKKTLENIGAEQKKILTDQSAKEKEIEANKIDLEEAQHSLEVNREMLALVPLTEKLKIFIDMKNNGLTIAKLKKDRLKLERADFTEANAIYERIYKEKFEFSIFGKDKEALKDAITQNNISYQIIWDEIDKEIEEQKKKKLNASEDGQNK